MRIFEFSDYKAFVVHRIEQMPQKGHGQYRKMAAHLNVGSVQISYVFRGERHLTDEQAIEVGSFFGLNDNETEFLLLLVQKERAGSYRLKNHYEQKLKQIRDAALSVRARIKLDLELTEALQATYYSNWYYSGVCLSCLIPGLNTPAKLAEHLKLPVSLVEETLQFLVSANLLKKEKGEKYNPTKEDIFIDKSSPFINRHHTNWRLKAIDNLVGTNNEREMFFTCPLTISLKLASELRKEFSAVIENLMKRIQQPTDEAFYCLNIDWFQVKR